METYIGFCVQPQANSLNMTCTRAVRKLSVNFEYLEYRSRCLDVTWQPVRGDLNLLKPNDIYIYMSYRSANLQTLHFIYLLKKYTY